MAGAARVALRRGPQGALVASARGAWHVPAAPDTRVVDTTGEHPCLCNVCRSLQPLLGIYLFMHEGWSPGGVCEPLACSQWRLGLLCNHALRALAGWALQDGE